MDTFKILILIILLQKYIWHKSCNFKMVTLKNFNILFEQKKEEKFGGK